MAPQAQSPKACDKEAETQNSEHVRGSMDHMCGTMPVERMRMRPWLEEQINSNTIPGLKWLNKVSVVVA
ncbi:Interferon regulatory factor 2 [Galemys pyrenaicus]|uniref:Interferon regulatory factor 2 n=1 Tax=Galemys pyrenaicus TaxID=202257 RepID=A0A8J6AKN0_GALPY|nr:Interferon regulatory factor 2 [Galemys pyrenaicus]